MPSPRFPSRKATLDMLILQILSLEPAHGYGIASGWSRSRARSSRSNQGSLYPALHRLQQKGRRRPAAVREVELGLRPGLRLFPLGAQPAFLL